MSKKGVLIVISGPSGAGKGTICSKLLKDNPDLFLSVSATTREPRKGEVDKVVVLHRDRLLRFGFELLENLCKKYGTTIEIVDGTPKTEEQELVEDLVQIITVFSCKLQGKRANKMKKVIAELKDENI